MLNFRGVSKINPSRLHQTLDQTRKVLIFLRFFTSLKTSENYITLNLKITPIEKTKSSAQNHPHVGNGYMLIFQGVYLFFFLCPNSSFPTSLHFKRFFRDLHRFAPPPCCWEPRNFFLGPLVPNLGWLLELLNRWAGTHQHSFSTMGFWFSWKNLQHPGFFDQVMQVGWNSEWMESISKGWMTF